MQVHKGQTIQKFCVAVAVALLLAGCGADKTTLYEKGTQLLDQGDYGAAIIHFKNALEKDPNYAAARFQLGVAYLEAGRFDQAEAEFQKTLRLNPYDKRVSLHLGRIENSRHNTEKAREHLRTYLEEYPDDAEAYEQLAYAADASGELQEAIKLLRKALELEPGRTSSQLGLAQTLVRVGHFDQAEEVVLSILETDPDNRGALHVQAQLARERGDANEVLAAYAHIASAHPTDILARYKEAAILGSRGELELLGEKADALVRQFPKKAEGHKLKGQYYYKKQRYEDAVGSFRTAVRLGPDLESYYLLGLSHYHLGNLELAVNQLQTVLDYNPEFIRARLVLARIHLQQHRGAEALAATGKILEMVPDDPIALALSGDALLLMGKADEALARYDRATKAAPELYRIHLKKGMLRVNLGMTEEGEADMRRAVDRAPEAAGPRLALHSLLLEQGRVNESLEVLRQGVGNTPDDAVLYDAMAKAMLRRKEPARARQMLEKAHEADPAYLPAYYTQATSHLFEGDKHKALDAYLAALAQAPEDYRARVGAAALLDIQGESERALEHLIRLAAKGEVRGALVLARFHLQHNRPQEAINGLNVALELHPDSMELQEMKAAAAQAAGDLEGAMTIYGQIETRDPWRGMMQKSRALIASGKLEQAESEAQRLIAMSPDKARSYLPAAHVSRAQGSFRQGAAMLDKALAVDPDDIEVLVAKARLEALQGHLSQAKKLYGRVLAKAPRNAEALTGMGVIESLAGNESAAVGYYTKAVSANPNSINALNNLAMHYADEKGKEALAHSLALRAYLLSGGEAAMSDTLGYALLQSGQAQEALVLFERAEATHPDNPQIQFHLALAHAALGKNRQALDRVERALANRQFDRQAEARSLRHALVEKEGGTK